MKLKPAPMTYRVDGPPDETDMQSDTFDYAHRMENYNELNPLHKFYVLVLCANVANLHQAGKLKPGLYRTWFKGTKIHTKRIGD